MIVRLRGGAIPVGSEPSLVFDDQAPIYPEDSAPFPLEDPELNDESWFAFSAHTIQYDPDSDSDSDLPPLVDVGSLLDSS